jgi:hypothetical protein
MIVDEVEDIKSEGISDYLTHTVLLTLFTLFTQDREVSASTQWAQDFAHEIAQGRIVKIHLSNRMQLQFQELLERETQVLNPINPINLICVLNPILYT